MQCGDASARRELGYPLKNLVQNGNRIGNSPRLQGEARRALQKVAEQPLTGVSILLGQAHPISSGSTSMKKTAFVLLDVILIGGAVLLCAAFWTRGFKAHREAVPRKDWKAIASIGTPLTPAGAPNIVAEFTDYQCPFCKTANIRLANLDPGKFSILIIHYPLSSIHPQAKAAAMAAECAREQGQFTAFHHALFGHQQAVEDGDWETIANSVPGVSSAVLLTCMQSTEVADRVAAHVELGKKLGVFGTPTLYVNRKATTVGEVVGEALPAAVGAVRE